MPKPSLPTMRSLMDDPIFRAYMKHIPPRHNANNTGKPWQLWINYTDSGKWATGQFSSYREVWPTFLQHYRATDRDVTITSRRVFYAPPGEWRKVKVRLDRPAVNKVTGEITTHRVESRWKQTFFWDGTDLHWCGRCRRPTYWMPLYSTHHALRKAPAIATDDNIRCILCGIRWIATPDIDQMER